MLQTYEAIMQPDWGLQFSDRTPPKFDHAQKVLVTVLQSPEPEAASTEQQTDWQQVTGLLKNSALFGGDPVAVQEAIRNEWR